MTRRERPGIVQETLVPALEHLERLATDGPDEVQRAILDEYAGKWGLGLCGKTVAQTRKFLLDCPSKTRHYSAACLLLRTSSSTTYVVE